MNSGVDKAASGGTAREVKVVTEADVFSQRESNNALKSLGYTENK